MKDQELKPHSCYQHKTAMEWLKNTAAECDKLFGRNTLEWWEVIDELYQMIHKLK